MTREMKDSGEQFIGKIPKNWKVSKLKYLLSRNDSGEWGTSPRLESNTLVLRSTEQKVDGTLNIKNPAKRYLTDQERNNTLLRAGDILITKSSGSYDHIGKASYITKELEEIGYSYSNFMQRLSIDFGSSRFFYYVINGVLVKKQFVYLSTTTSGLNNINAHTINNLIVPVPLLNEQKNIANFLDKKTKEIDTIISKTKKVIAEYKSYKQSLITETVTKGLNPDVEMKDSGVEWIGEIPQNWNLQKIKYAFTIINGNGFPEKYQGKTFGDFPFYKVSDINHGDIYVDIAHNYVNLDLVNEKKFNVIPKNSIMIGKIGEALKKNHRKINMSPSIIDNNMLALVPKRLNTKYAFYLLNIIDMYWFDNHGTIPSINNRKLLNFTIPDIKLKEQSEIVEYLDKKTQEIDEIISTKEELVEEMEAYKKSLIYETVTGKREVE